MVHLLNAESETLALVNDNTSSMWKVFTTQIIPISVCSYSKLHNAITIWGRYNIYLAKSFMFYNIWTTYWTFFSENWIPEYDVIALHAPDRCTH